MFRKLGRTVLVAAAAIGVVGIAGVAYGAVPSSDGSITACVDSKGAVKVIDAEAGEVCSPSRKTLTWNQEGPAGPAGLADLETVYEESDLNSNGDKTVFAMCPTGKQALGGGGGVYGEFIGEGQVIVDGVGLVQDHPFNEYGWAARATEFVPTDTTWQLVVWVRCAAIG
jgi:hypothetical protein